MDGTLAVAFLSTTAIIHRPWPNSSHGMSNEQSFSSEAVPDYLSSLSHGCTEAELQQRSLQAM